MKFKLRIRYKDGSGERIEDFDSEDLYLVTGIRNIRRIPFNIKSDTKEEFERFGIALMENYNQYNAETNHRELVEVIMDVWDNRTNNVWINDFAEGIELDSKDCTMLAMFLS